MSCVVFIVFHRELNVLNALPFKYGLVLSEEVAELMVTSGGETEPLKTRD